jgi:hypothetical protein
VWPLSVEDLDRFLKWPTFADKGGKTIISKKKI